MSGKTFEMKKLKIRKAVKFGLNSALISEKLIIILIA